MSTVQETPVAHAAPAPYATSSVAYAGAPAVTYASAPVSMPTVTYASAPTGSVMLQHAATSATPVTYAAPTTTVAHQAHAYAAAPVSYASAPLMHNVMSPHSMTYAAHPVTYAAAPATYAAAPVTFAAAPASASVQSSWDNHFAAFGEQNVDKILLDYTEASVITVFNQANGTQQVYKGLAGVTDCFTGLFKSLSDTQDLAAPVITVKEAAGEEPGSVFLVWNCKASGYQEATDTFIFDSACKIARQNVVVNYTGPGSEPGVQADEVPHGSGNVHSGWANHFEAFGKQSVDQILLDYTENSEITVYNQLDGKESKFKGLSGVRDCFTGLFKSLPDCTLLKAPVQHVEELSTSGPGYVFLVWSCASSGYHRATDTFIFNAAGKILRQNVVVAFEEKSAPSPQSKPEKQEKKSKKKKATKKSCCI